jgi:hypothetical protein
MNKTKKEAIRYKVGLAVNAFNQAAVGYATQKQSEANNNGLALRQTYRHIIEEMIPAFENEIRQYCLGLHVTDVGFISDLIQTALSTWISGAGNGIGTMLQGRSPGGTQREILGFKANVSAIANNVPARTRVAVEQYRHEHKTVPIATKIAIAGGIFAMVVGAFTVINYVRSWRTDSNKTAPVQPVQGTVQTAPTNTTPTSTTPPALSPGGR